MLRTTNNTRDFFENQEGPIFIYGAGMMGYWVGTYMKKCSMDFEGFIDKKVIHDECYYIGKRVYKIDKLKEYTSPLGGGQIRIIVPIVKYESALADLLEFDRKASLNMLCLTADYTNKEMLNQGDDVHYNINILLAYFRNKLFKSTIPTIISNDCFAGLMYQNLGLPMLSPTINVAIDSDDFVKLCENPEKYLNTKVTNASYGYVYNWGECPIINVKDISIYFAHDSDLNTVIKRWNIGIETINWENIIFVFSNFNFSRTLDETNRFIKAVKGKKALLISSQSSNFDKNTHNIDELITSGVNLYNKRFPVEDEII